MQFKTPMGVPEYSIVLSATQYSQVIRIFNFTYSYKTLFAHNNFLTKHLAFRVYILVVICIVEKNK